MTQTGRHGMVVSRHSHSSRIGAEMLRRGGTAIDAAVATHFAINVVNPMSVGIGGGGSLVYYDAADDTVSTIDFFPRAPSTATPEFFVDESGTPIDDSVMEDSGKAVAVPGAVKGLVAAHQRFGALPWDELLTPAIDLATGGVVVDRHLAGAIEDNWDRFNGAAKRVFGDNGTPLSAGELLVQPALAATFERIQDHQAAAIHDGPIADAIAGTVQEHGGALQADDLREYPVRHHEPLVSTYRDLTLYNPQLAITGGFLVPRILSTLERFDLGEQYGPQSWERYHLFAEATALAWADRAEYLGDPEFVDPPLAALRDPAFVDDRAEKISLDGTIADYRVGECVAPGSISGAESVSTPSGPPGDESTTHFVAGDTHGNVVAVTSSINKGMGSGIMVPEHGFMLNNYMSLFDAEPGGPNQVEGGKRPLSSTSPTLVFKDDQARPYFTAGSPGGVTIPQTTAQVILNVVEYGMEIDAAVSAPRITTDHCGPIEWERTIPAAVRQQLATLGHTWATDPDEIGSANNLMWRDGSYHGGPDPRRDCVAIGLNALYADR